MFEKGKASEGKIVYQIGDVVYTADAQDFKNLISEVVRAIKQYEVLNKVIVKGFGGLNIFNLNAPEVYKTGEDDSEAFKKLFE